MSVPSKQELAHALYTVVDVTAFFIIIKNFEIVNLITPFNNLKNILSKIKLTPHAYVAGETQVCIVIDVVVPDVSVPPL